MTGIVEILNLVEVGSIENADYVTINSEQPLKNITMGKPYRLIYGQAIGFSKESGVKGYRFNDDTDYPMTLECVWNMFGAKYYKIK
jgi:hypothetical protein